ncbi:efflux transporter periplasmic adaptor subunit [Haemophilus paracuniculus]|uniref:Efflux transporter periplasmic adaptor subunit n=1 Tax=Haemophilus paracuniculus TaxID=734 RepID=A0A1T0AUB4_9PAST|nr:efflux RND transporter periplasmic adaptor subunit [Haemophilus paracuniculus]OOS00289.1 efflux transporter periplasmic adaptor subunit [Haemophilus paracuniculus]
MTTETEVKKPSFCKRFALWLILLLVAAVFAAVVGFNMFIAQKKAEAALNMPENVSLVTVMQVGSSEWTPVIEAVGTVRPNQGAMLSSQMTGTVSRVLVQSGDYVKKGQLLVELDSAVERANLGVYEAQLPAALANLNRYKNLVGSNSASKAELDAAQSTYSQLVANIDAVKASINRRQIYSPFEGVAGIVKVNVGEFINVGTEIVRVEDASRMKVSFTLPQTDIERVRIGQKVTVTADAISGETFEARISAIDPAVNKTNGLVSLEASVAGRSKLKSGMFTRLRIALPTETSQVVVPQIAVTYSMYGETAYVLQPLSDEDQAKLKEQGKDVAKMYRVKQVEVKTADRQGIYAQLVSGVNVGDTIVTSGFQRLRNNALVQVVDKEPAGMTQPAKETRL